MHDQLESNEIKLTCSVCIMYILYIRNNSPIVHRSQIVFLSFGLLVSTNAGTSHLATFGILLTEQAARIAPAVRCHTSKARHGAHIVPSSSHVVFPRLFKFDIKTEHVALLRSTCGCLPKTQVWTFGPKQIKPCRTRLSSRPTKPFGDTLV